MTPQYERRRQDTQTKLDSIKSAGERNRLGQFATPYELAMDMLRYARSLLPTSAKVSFLDPGFGTGAFYSALMTVVPADSNCQGYGI